MNRIVCSGFFGWLMIAAAANAQSGPVLIFHDQPRYPPIAKAAHIEGSVTVRFLLDQQGKAISVQVVAGHAMLKGSAEEFVKSWKFDLKDDASTDPIPYETTIEFKLVRGAIDPRTSKEVTLVENTYRRFEVTALVNDSQMSKCPGGADQEAPPQETPLDFVELLRSGCYGSCPSYTVRVNADGLVEWDGRSYVETKGKRETRIDSTVARALIERFRTNDFWSLCGEYSRSITDSATATVEVEMGGRSREVSDYANSAPGFEQDLEMAIDQVSDSHLWRHGEPAREPITRLSPDSYLPKPGVTPLMRAAADGKIDILRALISSGAHVDDVDASGWTALMYGVASSSSEPVEILLKAGADPNHASLRGDTPLIASASERAWDHNLVEAGAYVNARNEYGQTALMFLAAYAQADEIRDALKDGADPSIKDAKGRTALDYLLAASCGRSPIADPLTNGGFETTYSKCNALDKDDVREARKLFLDSERNTRLKTPPTSR